MSKKGNQALSTRRATLPSPTTTTTLLLPLLSSFSALTSCPSFKLAPTLLSAITSRLTKSRSHSPQPRSSSKDASGAMGQVPSKKSKKSGKDKSQDKEEDVTNASPEDTGTPSSADAETNNTSQGNDPRTTGTTTGSSFVEQTGDTVNGASSQTGGTEEPNTAVSPPTSSGSQPPGPSTSCVLF